MHRCNTHPEAHKGRARDVGGELGSSSLIASPATTGKTKDPPAPKERHPEVFLAPARFEGRRPRPAQQRVIHRQVVVAPRVFFRRVPTRLPVPGLALPGLEGFREEAAAPLALEDRRPDGVDVPVLLRSSAEPLENTRRGLLRRRFFLGQIVDFVGIGDEVEELVGVAGARRVLVPAFAEHQHGLARRGFGEVLGRHDRIDDARATLGDRQEILAVDRVDELDHH
mmetsp:Transcript_478/g.1840  ORF Transcript_478/g.1840 Transcript_478/m.1840 type:complete len:225 (-) Transcript_478:1244-1918(-)